MTSTVKMTLDSNGGGSVILNGVHMERIIKGMRLFTEAGKGVFLQIDILADRLEFEGADIQTVIRELRPEDQPRQHEIDDRAYAGSKICAVCRQVVGNPKWNPNECPGPMPKKD